MFSRFANAWSCKAVMLLVVVLLFVDVSVVVAVVEVAVAAVLAAEVVVAAAGVSRFFFGIAVLRDGDDECGLDRAERDF